MKFDAYIEMRLLRSIQESLGFSCIISADFDLITAVPDIPNTMFGRTFRAERKNNDIWISTYSKLSPFLDPIHERVSFFVTSNDSVDLDYANLNPVTFERLMKLEIGIYENALAIHKRIFNG